MCGRYHLAVDPRELLESGGIEIGAERAAAFAPRFDIPTVTACR